MILGFKEIEPAAH